jgi:hypothetical protein
MGGALIQDQERVLTIQVEPGKRLGAHPARHPPPRCLRDSAGIAIATAGGGNQLRCRSQLHGTRTERSGCSGEGLTRISRISAPDADAPPQLRSRSHLLRTLLSALPALRLEQAGARQLPLEEAATDSASAGWEPLPWLWRNREAERSPCSSRRARRAGELGLALQSLSRLG